MPTYKNQYCPVCGYDMKNDFLDNICPSCGIQFGYNDMAGGDNKVREGIYHGWRAKWASDGYPYGLGNRPIPENWDPKVQLKNIDINMN